MLPKNSLKINFNKGFVSTLYHDFFKKIPKECKKGCN